MLMFRLVRAAAAAKWKLSLRGAEREIFILQVKTVYLQYTVYSIHSTHTVYSV